MAKSDTVSREVKKDHLKDKTNKWSKNLTPRSAQVGLQSYHHCNVFCLNRGTGSDHLVRAQAWLGGVRFVSEFASAASADKPRFSLYVHNVGSLKLLPFVMGAKFTMSKARGVLLAAWTATITVRTLKKCFQIESNLRRLLSCRTGKVFADGIPSPHHGRPVRFWSGTHHALNSLTRTSIFFPHMTGSRRLGRQCYALQGHWCCLRMHLQGKKTAQDKWIHNELLSDTNMLVASGCKPACWLTSKTSHLQHL